jgi:hypothetical protein
MGAVQLEWSKGHRSVSSCEELRKLLTEIEVQLQEHPELVDIVADSGAVLTVGLGAEAAVLSFSADPAHPPYFAGQGGGEGIGSIWFEYRGTPSEFPMDQILTVADALEAAAEFCNTGVRPSSVKWTVV